MASTKIQVIEKTEGSYIEYSVTTKNITFGDDELTINLSKRERDYETTLDICIDTDNGIVIGTGGNAQKYAAQVVIPARTYKETDDGEDEKGEARKTMVPVPFDMSKCTLYLWGLEE